MKRDHLAANERPGFLEVVSIEHTSRYDHRPLPLADTLTEWRRLLDPAQTTDAELATHFGTRMPLEIPWVNAGACYMGKVRRETFPWGQAALYLCMYFQGHTGGPVNSGSLILTLQGLTHDGRYAVRGHFTIRHPLLPGSTWDRRTAGKVIFDVDRQTDEARRWLERQPDDAFSPTFRQYETLLQSLRITATRH